MPDQSGSWMFPKESFQKFNPSVLLQAADQQVKNTGKNQGPLQFLQNFVSGGQLQAADETGSIGVTPGGQLNLTRLKNSIPQETFNVDPRQSSAGISFPVGKEGRIGLQGSWNQYNPSAEVNFRFGSQAKPFTGEGIDFSGLDKWEAKPSEKQPVLYNDLTPQQVLEKQILEYKTSGGRSLSSPSSWAQ